MLVSLTQTLTNLPTNISLAPSFPVNLPILRFSSSRMYFPHLYFSSADQPFSCLYFSTFQSTLSAMALFQEKILLMLCKLCRKAQKDKCRNGLSNYGMFYSGEEGFHHCLATVIRGNCQKPTVPLALIETESRQHRQFKITENTDSTWLYNLCRLYNLCKCCLSPTLSKKKLCEFY